MSKKKNYKNAGISLTVEEIRMADELARRRHLGGRTALVRQMIWREWERTFSQPRPGDMPLEQALEALKRVAEQHEA